MSQPGKAQPEAGGSEPIGPGALSALLQELARAPEDRSGARDRALWPGLLLGRYELVREIGRGGFGVVFEARDRELGREVALKAVRPGGRLDLREERLLSEAEAAARLSHPNIVTVYDAGRSEEGPYLVQELLRGETLAKRLERGPVPVREALRIGVEVAKGLAHAHGHGVVHRDLTPGNVFLCQDGQVKVLDLGMAHAFGRTKADGGTPAYMAPEQAAGAPEDERTDVFALGVVLFEMLSGKLPFGARHAGAPLALEVDGEPALGELVGRMLSRDPVRRPRNAGEVLAVLNAAAGREPSPPSAVRVRRKPRAPLLAFAAGLVALAAAAVVSVREVARTTAPPPSVAVLPFADLSPGHDQEYLAEGVAEAILNALARVQDFKVIGRTSSFSERLKNQDLRSIGRDLDVANVLEGSLQKQGQRIRVTARLVRVADGNQRWSEAFDREESGIFEVQDDIAAGVVEALKGKLLAERGGAGRPSAPTASPEAYYQYLLGLRSFHAGTIDDIRQALVAYQRAVKLDPAFAEAWAAQGVPLYDLAAWAPTREEAGDLMRRAESAVARALELSPDSCAGLYSRAVLRAHRWDWTGALVDDERAVKTCPGEADAWRRYGALLWTLGKNADAVRAMERAVRLDPLDALSSDALGWVQMMTGEWEAARASFERHEKVNPGSVPVVICMANQLLIQGRAAEALERLKTVAGAIPSSSVPEFLGAEAMALHSLGRDEEALTVVRQLEAMPSPMALLTLVGVYAWLGDRDRAFATLERAIDDRNPGLTMVSFPSDVPYRSLHDDPRWKPLLRRMNLPVD